MDKPEPSIFNQLEKDMKTETDTIWSAINEMRLEMKTMQIQIDSLIKAKGGLLDLNALMTSRLEEMARAMAGGTETNTD